MIHPSIEILPSPLLGHTEGGCPNFPVVHCLSTVPKVGWGGEDCFLRERTVKQSQADVGNASQFTSPFLYHASSLLCFLLFFLLLVVSTLFVPLLFISHTPQGFLCLWRSQRHRSSTPCQALTGVAHQGAEPPSHRPIACLHRAGSGRPSLRRARRPAHLSLQPRGPQHFLRSREGPVSAFRIFVTGALGAADREQQGACDTQAISRLVPWEQEHSLTLSVQ